MYSLQQHLLSFTIVETEETFCIAFIKFSQDIIHLIAFVAIIFMSLCVRFHVINEHNLSWRTDQDPCGKPAFTDINSHKLSSIFIVDVD